MTETNLSLVPVQAQERIQVIDVLRGFAILGILLFNMRGFSGQAFPAMSWPEPLDRAIVILLDFLVQAKFYSLFSFLFGWGMAVQMRRMESRGKKFFPVYLRRMIILLLFGIIHKGLIWTGDILLMYAVLGLIILLVFRKLPPKLLLIAAFLFLLSVILLTLPGETIGAAREWCANFTSCLSTDSRLPESLYRTGTYWEVIQLRIQQLRNGFRWFPCYLGNVIAMMLLGLYTGKRRIFENFEIHQQMFRQVMWVGLILGVVLNGYFAYISAYPFTSEYYSLIRISARTIGAPALTLFYITGLTLLYQQEQWKIRLSPLASVGRMALTNYISHSLFLPLFFYGYGLGFYGLTDPTFGVIFTLVIYRAQIQFSRWWFEHYQFGPLEWLWRTLTYAIRLPLSIEASYNSLNKLTKKQRRIWTATLIVLVLSIISVGILFGDQRIIKKTQRDDVDQTLTEEVEETTTQSPETILDEMSAAFAEAMDHPLADAPLPDPSWQDPGRVADLFDPESAFSHLEILSSDPYQGRYAGTPAGKKSGDYLASQYARFSLRPVGSAGSYFQSFPLQSLLIGSEPSLRITKPDGETREDFQMHRDYIPELGGYAGPGHASGSVIWAVNCTQQDFHKIEVMDRIVFCRLDDLPSQVRLAAENQAAGLLLLTDDAAHPPDLRKGSLEAWIPDPIPVFQVYAAVAADLLAGSGFSVADLSILYEPIDLNSSVEMEVETRPVCNQEICTGRNLLGVIPGSDPDLKDQVIILSANYDGLGTAPDGTIWPGANDNASGVAILLEVARSWQEEGFDPAVTVLFAAWDAREQDLQGLDYFLQNPIYPLENTIAVIHLDQLGAGSGLLQITGEGALAEIQAAAAGIGVETISGSFQSAEIGLLLREGLPVSAINWEEVENRSHRPADRIDTIQLERLEQAGTITGLVVFQLAEVPIAIDGLLARRCEAITSGDMQAFLNTSTSRQVENDRFWFEDVRSLDPESCAMTTSDLQVTGSTARASITIQLELSLAAEDEDQEVNTFSIRMPASFKIDPTGWRWDGPQLDIVETGSAGKAYFTVHHQGENSGEMIELARSAAAEYTRIAELLSLNPELKADIYVYSGANILKADTSPALDGYLSTWVGRNSLKFASNPMSDQDELRGSITQLLLANYGIPRQTFPWLWEGLPLLLENNHDQILQQSDKLIQLQNDLSAGVVEFKAETSWAAVKFIEQNNGYAGLGNLIQILGSACQLSECLSVEGSERALLEALQMDQSAFNNAWTSYWRSRLDEAQQELDAVFTRRTNAVLSGDLASFLETVDRQIPNFYIEERDWFRGLSQYPPETFQITGKPIAILDSGDILADVKVRYTLPDAPPPLGRGSLSAEILFKPSAGELLWTGAIFHSVRGDHIRVRYPPGLDEEAKSILEDADQIYANLAQALEIANPNLLTINLYEDKFLFRSSVSLSFPGPEWIPGWTAPDHSIKLFLDDDPQDDVFQRALQLHLSRQVLMQIGIEDEWILTGGSCYLSGDAAGDLLQHQAEKGLIRLVYIFIKEAAFDLTEFPDLYQLPEEDYQVAITQACDSMGYFADAYGHDALIDLLAFQGENRDLDTVMQSVIHRSAKDLFMAWQDSFLQGHLPVNGLNTALEFNVDEAQKHIDFLTAPELAGRQAGSPGSDRAADYIAELFSEAGLDVSQQYFAVPYQTYLEKPHLDLWIGGSRTEFAFREDFLVLQIADDSELLSGQLVWVADDAYAGMELDGKIVIRKPESSIGEEIEKAASHGARALILVDDKNRDLDLLSKYPFPSNLAQDPIPVLELTASGFDRFLELLDIKQADLYHAQPATLLDAQAHLQIRVSELVISETSNIIGYLPGSNPDLKDELIIIGAHYDHVGYELGIPYSGENDNATGIAALLEFIRLLTRQGYQPGRSLLFIAWGAQEAGELGSQYYVANPLYPLEDTVAMLQLDAIGGGDGYYLEAQGSREKDALLLFSFHRASELASTRLYIAAPQAAALTDPAWLYSPASLFDRANMKITSDDVPFRLANIPTLLIQWQKASESNLPDSIADPVLPDRLENSGKTILLALMMLAR